MLRKIASSTWCAPEKAPMLPVVAFRAAVTAMALALVVNWANLLQDAVIVFHTS